ncbi:CLAVATA3/ESR (CLE)-related protein 5 [Hibiscus syriacus]|uniref:CLAVATA3/ESR (CLE)-related protein 5 n=1 Tax=Hibiscus syriacus TaxID=106335 RepID=A0A6A3BT41_HIBSY|nr:CLAVATA3/ESR (CLE)-related protein 5 [Hibiscus syriacus]KAE8718109.1 CLAVATA3/ESR (CLE)-related protein 5 [Hibiscus syriacus]
MATHSTVPSALTLFLILFLMLPVGSPARILRQAKTDMQRVGDSQLLLHELGFDLHQLNRYRKLAMHGPTSDRVSPGGPDPQHHF